MKTIFILFFLFSCSSITQKTTSAEISIDSAEKVVEKMPESSDKELLKIALKQSKSELKDYRSITEDLTEKKEKAVEIAQSKSETAGKWEGIRNVALFAVFIFGVFVVYKVLNKFKGVSL
ncbi:MAG: hypothetical protein L6Q54_15600 [Leptospiraceae bacterium]|nr:hypothetical protein [Leptospiraceae bacterium]NUM42854.1 hypothetical protein [Leptospiraceae bacterium]